MFLGCRQEMDMDPITIAGLISGGASLLGNVFSSDQTAQNTQNQILAQQRMQAESENFNAQQANLNRQFQAGQVSQQEAYATNMVGNQQAYETQMSNTAYQRSVADMKKAGLNPAMMFSHGGPETVPSIAAPSGSAASGSTASIGTPSVPMPQNVSPFANLGDAVGKMISGAKGYIDLLQGKQDVSNANKTGNLIQAKTQAQELDNMIRGGASTEEIQKMIEDSAASAARRKSAEYQADVDKNTAITARNVVEGVNPSVRKAADIANYTTSQVGKNIDNVLPFAHGAKAIKNLLPQRSTVETTRSDGPSSFSERFNY